jgi:energy-coupling factor transporter ATP-binding protein EcfA2
MDIAKLTLGKKVYTNLTGEQASMKIALHNAMKNIPAYMSGYAKEIEHMTPRNSSFTELVSDFFQKDSHEYKQVVLAGPKGNGKSTIVKILEEIEKHQIKLPRFEPCGWSDMHTMIDRNGNTHIFSDLPKQFELTRINPSDEIKNPYKLPELTAEQKETYNKLFEKNPPRIIFPESGVGKTQIAPKKLKPNS